MHKFIPNKMKKNEKWKNENEKMKKWKKWKRYKTLFEKYQATQEGKICHEVVFQIIIKYCMRMFRNCLIW